MCDLKFIFLVILLIIHEKTKSSKILHFFFTAASTTKNKKQQNSTAFFLHILHIHTQITKNNIPEVLKANVKRCLLRPGQCNMVSWCKHLQLQRQCTPPEDADTPSTCTGACDSKTTHADCEAESTCTWIGMEGEPGRCL